MRPYTSLSRPLLLTLAILFAAATAAYSIIWILQARRIPVRLGIETGNVWTAAHQLAIRSVQSPHSSLGPAIPEPPGGIPVLEISGHRIPCGQRVVASAVLAGLHHEYRLEKIAA